MGAATSRPLLIAYFTAVNPSGGCKKVPRKSRLCRKGTACKIFYTQTEDPISGILRLSLGRYFTAPFVVLD